MLFLAYINDLPKHVCCSISLLADNTPVYQIVDNAADKLNFQKNIDALPAWIDTWCMSINVSKRSVMLFNQTLKFLSSNYRLGNVSLYIVQWSKYLGILLQSDLKFLNHICDKVNKANRQLGTGIGKTLSIHILTQTTCCICCFCVGSLPQMP